MNESTQLARNTLLLTLASIGQKIVAFVYFAIIARIAGVEDTGSYFLALAMTSMIVVIDDLGITSVIIREVAKKPGEALRWSQTMLGIKVFTIPVTVLLAWFVPDLRYDGVIVELVRIAILILIFDTLSVSFYGILRGLRQLQYESLGVFVGQSITAIVGVSLMATGHLSLHFLVVALVLGSAWNCVFSAVQVVRRLGIDALRPILPTWSPLVAAWPFFLATIFVKIYSYTDSLVLSHFFGEGAVGIYAVAYKMTYAFQFLPMAFVAALYPAMSSASHDPIELKKLLKQSLWYMALLSSTICFGLWSVAPEVIGAFYGAEYTASALPLQVLIFVLLFIFLDYPLGSLLNATHRQATKTGIMGITMLINVGLNFVLIPQFEVLGACVAALVSFAFMFVASFYAVRRVVPLTISEVISTCGGLILSGAIMAGAVTYIKPFVHFTLAVPFGAVVFFVCAWQFKELTPDHARGFYRLIRRKTGYVEEIPLNG